MLGKLFDSMKHLVRGNSIFQLAFWSLQVSHHVSTVPSLAGGQTGSASSSGDPLQDLQYWTRFDLHEDDYEKKFPPKPALSHRKYVTFEDDTGGMCLRLEQSSAVCESEVECIGWNNIRMAFEVFVLVAKITGRILVVPPPCR